MMDRSVVAIYGPLDEPVDEWSTILIKTKSHWINLMHQWIVSLLVSESIGLVEMLESGFLIDDILFVFVGIVV